MPPDEPEDVPRVLETNEFATSGQRDRTDATRQALMEAAQTVLREGGYTHATVARITRKAGRAHGTFYLYFQNKEDVYSQLLANMWADLKEQSRSIWRTDSPLESVRVTVTRYISAFAYNVDLWRLLEELSVTNSRFDVIRDQIRRGFACKIQRGIESSYEYANIDGFSTELMAELLAGMVDQACAARYLHGRSWSEEEMVDHIVTVWGRSIGYLIPNNEAPAH